MVIIAENMKYNECIMLSMVEIKLETGENVKDLGKLFLYIIIAGAVISAVFFAVALFYFMVVNPLP